MSGRKSKHGAASYIHTVSLPIAGPECPNDWPQLRDELSHGFRAATEAMNWAMHELFSADAVLVGDDNTKLPPLKGSWGTISPGFRERWPGMSASMYNPLLRAAIKKYKQYRYSLLRAFDRRMPHWRFPQPIPLKAKTYRVEYDGQSIWLRFRLAGIKRVLGRSWRVRLRGGRGWHRQVREIREVIGGDGEFLQAILVAKSQKGSSWGNGKFATPIMAKFVVRRPVRHGAAARPNTLLVRTQPDALLVARVRGDSRNCRWMYADHVPRTIIAHNRQIERLRRDCKSLSRTSVRRSESLVAKMDDRKDTWCKQIAATVARWATRTRCGRIVYDDGVRSFVPKFPWVQLESAIGSAAGKNGIEFVTARAAEAEAAKNKVQEQWLRLQADLAAMMGADEKEEADEPDGGRAKGDEEGGGDDGRDRARAGSPG